MATWLVIDGNYLCHRAFYTVGSLVEGTVFGFLKDFFTLQERFDTKKVVFCFDSRDSKRKEKYPNYKSGREMKRNNSTDEEAEMRRQFYMQVIKLRRKTLPGLGYSNIFMENGYEADDIIASVVMMSIPKEDSVIMVSADKDLYQLLAGTRIIFYNPQKGQAVTQDSFIQEYGISPKSWIKVKAIAGCNTDSIEGIKGVGEKTAIKHLLGHNTKFSLEILNAGEMIKRNTSLVRLPYKGTPVFELKPDKIDKKSFQEQLKELGFESLTRKE